jgi:hypothetical protein
LERIISTDYTDTSNFLDIENKWCLDQANNNKLNVICGSKIITKTTDGNPVFLDDLFQNTLINYDKNAYGLLIPHDKIQKHNHYNWFLKLNIDEIKQSDNMISYFLQKYI